MINQNFKNKFVLFSILIFLLSIGLHAEKINPTQEMWDSMEAEIDHWIDGAGYPIDQEIKETVIALNLMGIETISSCGGHLDHGLPYPWIEIQTYPPQIRKMMQELSEIQEQLNTEEILLKTRFPHLSYNDIYDIPEAENLPKLHKTHSLIAESIKQMQIKCLEPLNQLLTNFYENRKTAYNNVLIIPNNSSAFLRSVGADRQHIRSSEEQSYNLNKFREEMKAFAVFLKQKLTQRSL